MIYAFRAFLCAVAMVASACIVGWVVVTSPLRSFMLVVAYLLFVFGHSHWPVSRYRQSRPSQ